MAEIVSSHIQQSPKHVCPHFLRRYSLWKNEIKERGTKTKELETEVVFTQLSSLPSLPQLLRSPHLVIHSKANTRIVAFVLNHREGVTLQLHTYGRIVETVRGVKEARRQGGAEKRMCMRNRPRHKTHASN